jgi:hypothetical protein
LTVGAAGWPGPAVVISSLATLASDFPPPVPLAVTRNVYDFVATSPPNSHARPITLVQSGEPMGVSGSSVA